MDERISKLIEELTVRTQSGTIKWRETDDSTTFAFSASRSTVLVDVYWSENMQEMRARYVIQDAAGRDIDGEGFTDTDEEFERIEALHTLARRNALDIDATLDSLFAELNIDEDSDK